MAVKHESAQVPKHHARKAKIERRTGPDNNAHITQE
jgi:hypothetical protein